MAQMDDSGSVRGGAMRVQRWIAGAAVSLVIVAPAAAQSSASADIARKVFAGDHVVVIEDDARVTTGRVEKVAPAALTLVGRDHVPVTIDASRIRRITERDSVINGAH